MSEILIDFRPRVIRRTDESISLLNHCGDSKIEIIHENLFTVISARVDSLETWGSFRSADNKIIIALSGRIALEPYEWKQAENVTGQGGLACKAIYLIYQEKGVAGLKILNGSFLVFIYDSSIESIFVVTDRCGMFPCYGDDRETPNVICSHPDVLAKVLNISNDWDMVSLAEFLVAGRVSFPNSYYKGIKALDYGSIYAINVRRQSIVSLEKEKYFNFHFNLEEKASEWDLAEQLSFAFKKAVNRRTLSLFGQSAISLSAGLDSRAVLCSAERIENIWAFCFFDEINTEFKIAEKIAQAARVRFIPFKRDFDYYGSNAEKAVEISGGMGDFANNHHLGFREKFKAFGIDNILTGFYCDYIFKGLVFNKTRNKILSREKFSSFEYSNYMPFFWFDSSYSKKVRDRQDALIPDELKRDESDYGRLEVEYRRTFPLCTEVDNNQNVIPQKVLGWFPPIVDNDLINIYLKIPPAYKLNTSMYSKTVELICGRKISNITNNNTGARVNANQASVMINGLITGVRNRLKKRRKSIATNISWPNWDYYIQNSKVIESLWMREREIPRQIIGDLIGSDPFAKLLPDYVRENKLKLLLRILTLKIWINQKA